MRKLESAGNEKQICLGPVGIKKTGQRGKAGVREKGQSV